MVLSVSAGLTHGEICAHGEEIYGVKMSTEDAPLVADFRVSLNGDDRCWEGAPSSIGPPRRAIGQPGAAVAVPFALLMLAGIPSGDLNDSGKPPKVLHVEAIDAGNILGEQFRFDPNDLAVSTGTTLLVGNVVGKLHTLTADDGSFTTGLIIQKAAASPRRTQS